MTFTIISAIALIILVAILATPIWADFQYARYVREWESKVWY